MSIKDVLLLADSKSSKAGAYAVSLASKFDAHLTAAGLVLDLTSPNAREVLSYDVFVSVAENQKSAMRRELESFAQEARLNDVHTEVEVISAPLGTARQALARLARRFDLAVVEQSDVDRKRDRDLELEAVLFGSGRPVIAVPYIYEGPLRFDRMLVAWDGGSVAARAIGDAMALLVTARQVQIVTVVDAPDQEIEIPGVDIARHLARHGINAELKILPHVIDVANTLLSYAADCSADLLVMGGYGHSRLREFVFGGTTRAMLQTMTLPVFMSH
jgi:nucleotide-binding universal stress UspA family protein